MQIAEDAGIELRGRGKKRICRCPLHEDRHASAFISEQNVFHCSVCTPGGGMSAKGFAAKLGRDLSRRRHGVGSQRSESR